MFQLFFLEIFKKNGNILLDIHLTSVAIGAINTNHVSLHTLLGEIINNLWHLRLSSNHYIMKKNNIDYINIMRGIAIILVVIGHFNTEYSPSWYKRINEVISL